PVVARAAAQHVVTCAAIQSVVAAAAAQPVVTLAAVDPVVARARVVAVVGRAELDPVVTARAVGLGRRRRGEREHRGYPGDPATPHQRTTSQSAATLSASSATTRSLPAP